MKFISNILYFIIFFNFIFECSSFEFFKIFNEDNFFGYPESKGFFNEHVDALKFSFVNETCEQTHCSGLVRVTRGKYHHIVHVHSKNEMIVICSKINSNSKFKERFDLNRFENSLINYDYSKIFYCLNIESCSVRYTRKSIISNLKCFFSNISCND